MSYEDYQSLQVHIEQGANFVTIDHPPMNLMNREMIKQLSRFLDEVEQDHAVRVIVFESALPGFFLGNFDLQGLQTPPPVGPKAGTLMPFHLLTERYRTSPKVTIACIDGRTSMLFLQGAWGEISIGWSVVCGSPGTPPSLQGNGDTHSLLPSIRNGGVTTSKQKQGGFHL